MDLNQPCLRYLTILSHFISLIIKYNRFMSTTIQGAITISGIYDVARPFKGSWAEIVRATIWKYFYISVFATSALIHAPRSTRSDCSEAWWTAMTSTAHHLWSPLYHLRHLPPQQQSLLPPFLGILLFLSSLLLSHLNR
jgi:hypothetical protein